MRIRKPQLNATMAIVIFFMYFLMEFVGSTAFYYLVGICYIISTRRFSETSIPENIFVKISPIATVLGLIIGGITVIVMTRIFGKDIIQVRGPLGIGLCRSTKAQIFYAIIWGALISFSILLFRHYFLKVDTTTEISTLQYMAISPGIPQLCWIAMMLVIAPFIEEFLFRGVLLAGISRSLNQECAVAIVTLSFIVVHMIVYPIYFISILTFLTVAIITVFFKVRTGSLFPAMAAHFAFNLIVVIVVIINPA